MSDKSVTILMGVYNGALHLGEQLESIAAQDHGNWQLIASDDGSNDASRAILQAFGAELVEGPRRGFSANFMHLIARFPQAGGYLALSDQDDIWLPDHLSRALAALDRVEGPAVYCARTWVAEHGGGARRLSRGCPRGTAFRNALVQNVVAGNTIVANPAAAAILRDAAAVMPPIPAHDWFIYQLISGAGGKVIFDDSPALIYRQHRGNAMGANNGIGAKLARLTLLQSGQLRQWLAQNEVALCAMAPWLNGEARELAQAFARVRAMRPSLARALALRRLGLYRQTRSSTYFLWLAALRGWI